LKAIQGHLSKFSASIWLLLGGLVALVLMFIGHVRTEKQIDVAHSQRQQAILLSDELRHSSEDLSSMVRSYVATGKPLFKARYQEVLGIREGTLPRPLDYQGIYWDLVLTDDVRPRGFGPAVPLLELMRQAGFSADEFAKLADAKKNSDNLTQLEFTAMALAESDGASGSHNRLEAMHMLEDDRYRAAKAAIMRPISEFDALADQRTIAALQAAEQQALVLRNTVIALALLLLVLVWRIRNQLHTILGGSVQQLYAQILRLGNADFSAPIAVAEDRQGSVMGWLAESHNKLARLELHQFKAVVDSADDAIISKTLDGIITSWNPAAQRIFGFSAQESVGQSMLILIPVGRELEETQLLAHVAAGGSRQNLQSVRRCKNGRLIDVSVSIAPILNDAGRVIGVSSIARDITAHKLAEEKLQLAASVFSHARECIMITDASANIVDVNTTFTKVTGYTREEAMGQHTRLLQSERQSKEFYAGLWQELQGKGHWQGEIWHQRKNRELYPAMLTISAVHNPAGFVQNYVALFSDITTQKAHQGQLEHIAHYDALTNLPNRVLLADRLKQAMLQAQRRGEHVALAYLDLDGFKAVNDAHGHHVGDQLLIEVAARMKQVLREGDTLARLGGDEFVAVLIGQENASTSTALLTRLLNAAAQSVSVGELQLQVSASLGVTFYPQQPDLDPDQLLRQADQAMYQAKLAGKNRFYAFDASQDTSLRVHHESVERLRLALQRREFVLHYQPKVHMRNGTVLGAEALIRWQHPERGLLSPAAFLPAIENHSLAVKVGEWVIDTALTQLEQWRALGLDIAVSVNVGARQLQQSDFLQRLQTILAAHPGLPASRLELEILETSALEDVTQISRLIEACAAIGVGFALDDFGTGYSSLTYLKRLRVETLKIDQSFVRDMLDDPDDLAILEGVIGLAAAFRRQVIAEGVETAAHGQALLHLGCHMAQGYGIARPMPGAALPQWAADWQPDPSWTELPWLGGGE
jgi:diguanylate cyclase (GGDEF)-like protein/PAS domain S-box-containing protein